MTAINRDIGHRPALEWVDVALIDVDHNYQRDVDGARVEKILAEFRWDHFGAVVLARQANGRFMVTDGQHRVKAGQLHPDVTHVPAIVIGVSGSAAEAENFLRINRDRKAVTTLERYWAALAAGDPIAERVRDVLAAEGCEVAPAAGSFRPHWTFAVTAVQRALERYGDAATRSAIRTIRGAWPDEPNALRGVLITALARIHRENGKLDSGRLIRVLAPKSYAEMAAAAEAARKLLGGDAATALARTVSDLYNRGLHVGLIYFGQAA
jgi:hypothetical protein